MCVWYIFEFVFLENEASYETTLWQNFVLFFHVESVPIHLFYDYSLTLYNARNNFFQDWLSIRGQLRFLASVSRVLLTLPGHAVCKFQVTKRKHFLALHLFCYFLLITNPYRIQISSASICRKIWKSSANSLEERHSMQLDQRRTQLLTWSRGKCLKKSKETSLWVGFMRNWFNIFPWKEKSVSGA